MNKIISLKFFFKLLKHSVCLINLNAFGIKIRILFEKSQLTCMRKAFEL